MSLGKPALGNRAIARKLNTEGLEALDVNPYFRSREKEDLLMEHDIESFSSILKKQRARSSGNSSRYNKARFQYRLWNI